MSQTCGAQMDLRELLADMNGPLPELDLSDIATHSRDVGPGGLFLACKGTREHGLRFLADALMRGARAVAWEPAPGVRPPDLPASVPAIAVPQLRRRLGEIANRFFARPSEELAVCGITGTNGKTTVAWLVVQALGQLGRRAGYIGTLGHGLESALQANPLTTPGCITLHRLLRGFLGAGATHAVMEVSSHALDQARVDGVRFRTAAFTNLSRDHLDYHGDFAAYRRAKSRLFVDRPAGHAVINMSHEFGRELATRLPAATRLIGVAAGPPAAQLPAADVVVRRLGEATDGQRIRVSCGAAEAEFVSPLWGAFNAENLAVAAGILLAEEFSLEAVASALAQCTAPPGRMERVGPGRPQVFVDFAHTPDALRRVLATLREHTAGRIWCVFGCGGERDRGKRAVMGATARELADRLIITDDNPRSEDPRAIVADILMGAGEDPGVEVVHDRATAIGRALQQAAPDDVVLVAGKGHEAVQIIGGESRPFSDQAVIRSLLGHTT